MKKLFRFLKPYSGSVLMILIVLMVQAYCDLSLPTYTSDIVNVGIQQSGITEKVPDEIAKEDLEHLLLFVPSAQQKTVQEAFEESQKSYDYDGKVLALKESVKEEQEEELASVLAVPMMMVSGIDSGSDTAVQMEEEMRQKMKEQMQAAAQGQMQAAAQGQMQAVPQAQMQAEVQSQTETKLPDVDSMTLYEMIGMMDPKQRDPMIDQMEEQMAKLPETMTEQAATVYVKAAYEKIGLDTGKMSSSYIMQTGAKMLGLAALGMLASILVGLMASKVAAGIGQGLRRDVFQKVVGFSNAEFDKFSTASLITRSTNDIQQIQLLMVMLLRMVLYAPIMAAGGVWKVFNTNVDMCWIIGLGILMILLVVIALFVLVMPKFEIVQNQIDRLNLVSREILTGLPVIRAFGTQEYEEERFDGANKDLTKTNLFVNRAMTFMMPMMMLIMNAVTVLIVWVGGHSINDGAMQVGDMMAFIQYTMQIIMSFLMICMISVMLPRAAVSAERVDEVLKSQTLIHDPKEAKTFSKEGKGEVCFDHVSFRYPGAEEYVLEDISFTAKPGETTAFIGSTGSGKSTLVNLIPRFYDVTEGKIMIDGEDIREVTQHDLREKIGYVPQKGVLFSGNVASNILYGNPDGTQEEMEEAAKIAQATEFIEHKKKRYQSPISQGGANVSGGQKQRLSIARAIAKHPEIYIFDDSFSALDYKSDVTLRKALKEKTADSTVLIVAQRISTILQAEQIIVLDNGKVVGKGTHKELLKNCEAYYQIASSQLSEKELAEDLKEVE